MDLRVKLFYDDNVMYSIRRKSTASTSKNINIYYAVYWIAIIDAIMCK